jgi:HEAT repeat protein
VLGFQQDARAVPDLLNILQNAEEEIWLRHEAAKSLAMIAEGSTISTLANKLNNPQVEWLIRAGIAEGIGRYYEILISGEDLSKTDAWRQVPVFDVLSKILKDEHEVLELRIAAAKGLGGIGGNSAVDVLASIVHTHLADNLGFWAAISIVKLTNGNPDDVSVVTTIRDYHEVSEGNGLEIKSQQYSLQTLKENGGWKTQLALAYLGWLVALVPILMALAGIFILFRFVRKSRSRNQSGEVKVPGVVLSFEDRT